MIRESTTPTTPATRRRIASAMVRDLAESFPVIRTLIGDDFPSFIAAWIVVNAFHSTPASRRCASPCITCSNEPMPPLFTR